MEKKDLTTRHMAEYCNVTSRTVVQWINQGKIKAYRTPGNHSRVKREDFISFLRKYNMPISHELENESQVKRILIVDDESSVVESIKRILSLDKKLEINCAYDGFEAGKMFSVHQPDLVILDLKMPKIDGYQLITSIRKESKEKEVKILIVSGVLDSTAIEKVLKLGADDYLAKPFDNQDLKNKVYQLFGWSRREGDF